MYVEQTYKLRICFTKHNQALTVILSAFLMVGASLTSTTSLAQPFEVGQQVFNACKTVAVLERPADFWSELRRLKFGASVVIKGLTGKYELPASDKDSKQNVEMRAEQYPTSSRADAVDPKTYTRHAWLEIGPAEYVPANCFVIEKLFKQQNMERAKRKIATLSTSKGKKGFSEDEEGDLTAMKGAAGQVSGGRPNYSAIDKHLNTTTTLLGNRSLKEFMESGGLM